MPFIAPRTTFFYFVVNHTLFGHFCSQWKLWEFKIHILACELLIDTRKHFNLVLCIVLPNSVQMDLDERAAVQLDAEPRAGHLTGENQVLQDGVVPGGQSAAPRTRLLIFCVAFSSWRRQNSPLSDADNILPTEHFLQFAY